jgi:hypothetical protein
LVHFGATVKHIAERCWQSQHWISVLHENEVYYETTDPAISIAEWMDLLMLCMDMSQILNAVFIFRWNHCDFKELFHQRWNVSLTPVNSNRNFLVFPSQAVPSLSARNMPVMAQPGSCKTKSSSTTVLQSFVTLQSFSESAMQLTASKLSFSKPGPFSSRHKSCLHQLLTNNASSPWKQEILSALSFRQGPNRFPRAPAKNG